MSSTRLLLRATLVALVCSCAFAFPLTVTTNLVTGRSNSTFSTFVDTANNMLVARAVLARCTAVIAHTHNAPELLYLVEGELNVGYVVTVAGPPASSRLNDTRLKAGEVFTFPQGLIHYQHNVKCKPAVFTATFPAAAPGTQFVARDMSVLPASYLKAQYNGDVPSKPMTSRFFLDHDCVKRCS